ncbi:hypothetical protein BDR26DRAFT_870039 [Obelidium mucronatum]|nr:hypothetical protein BDR26DRAFT_870039 [Obelidium mucronatum]
MQQKQREVQKRLAVRDRAVSFLSIEAERLETLKEMEVLLSTHSNNTTSSSVASQQKATATEFILPDKIKDASLVDSLEMPDLGKEVQLASIDAATDQADFCLGATDENLKSIVDQDVDQPEHLLAPEQPKVEENDSFLNYTELYAEINTASTLLSDGLDSVEDSGFLSLYTMDTLPVVESSGTTAASVNPLGEKVQLSDEYIPSDENYFILYSGLIENGMMEEATGMDPVNAVDKITATKSSECLNFDASPQTGGTNLDRMDSDKKKLNFFSNFTLLEPVSILSASELSMGAHQKGTTGIPWNHNFFRRRIVGSFVCGQPATPTDTPVTKDMDETNSKATLLEGSSAGQQLIVTVPDDKGLEGDSSPALNTSISQKFQSWLLIVNRDCWTYLGNLFGVGRHKSNTSDTLPELSTTLKDSPHESHIYPPQDIVATVVGDDLKVSSRLKKKSRTHRKRPSLLVDQIASNTPILQELEAKQTNLQIFAARDCESKRAKDAASSLVPCVGGVREPLLSENCSKEKDLISPKLESFLGKAGVNDKPSLSNEQDLQHETQSLFQITSEIETKPKNVKLEPQPSSVPFHEDVKSQLLDVAEKITEQHNIAKGFRMRGSGIQLFEKSSKVIETLNAVHTSNCIESAKDAVADVQSLISESTTRHQSLATRTLVLTAKCLGAVRRQLRKQHVPILDSPNEGEALCAFLTATGRAYASATEDMDCCVFGDGPVVRHLGKSVTYAYRAQLSPEESEPALEVAEKQELLQIDPLKLRNALELSREQYVDLMILCGTDFSSTLKQVGDKKAIKLIKEHISIDAILALEKFEPNEGFDHVGARKVFMESFKEMEEYISLDEVDNAIKHFKEMAFEDK